MGGGNALSHFHQTSEVGGRGGRGRGAVNFTFFFPRGTAAYMQLLPLEICARLCVNWGDDTFFILAFFFFSLQWGGLERKRAGGEGHSREKGKGEMSG